MTKFKVCSKIHLFIIISSIFICLGLAVGTICHFVPSANGFFNYGGEFASYRCITITYPETVSQEEVKLVCDNVIPTHNGASFGNNGKSEAVYKFDAGTDMDALEVMANKIETELNELVSSESLIKCTATVKEVEVNEGGAKAITYASIALASAAAFMFIYYVIRYKLRAAFSALLACVHNLGIFVALLAITRIPVATEAIAIGAAVVVLTMIFCGHFFGRTRKNFKNEKYEKTDRVEVVDISAIECRKTVYITVCALCVAALIFSVFTTIAALYIGAFAPGIVAIFGVIACGYGAMFFTPAVHNGIDALCEKVKADFKTKKRTKKSKPAATAAVGEQAK